MKLRTVALGGAAATIGGVVLWRRRRRAPSPPPVQLGLQDGTTATLDDDDPGVPELRQLAAGLRRRLEADH